MRKKKKKRKNEKKKIEKSTGKKCAKPEKGRGT
jgi:hypothetical protein